MVRDLEDIERDMVRYAHTREHRDDLIREASEAGFPAWRVIAIMKIGRSTFFKATAKRSKTDDEKRRIQSKPSGNDGTSH